MSSYLGDDILLAGKFKRYVKKQWKAAGVTTARFDPTSKTAKYGKYTRGALKAAAGVGLAAITGGVGALTLVGAAADYRSEAIKRLPKKKGAPVVAVSSPLGVARGAAGPKSSVLPDVSTGPEPVADTSTIPVSVQSNISLPKKKNLIPVIAGVGALAVILIVMTTKK